MKLTVVSGPFAPGLENAFLGRLAELKEDPFVPVAVVAPSARLVERLQLAISGSGAAYLNLHFHTFSSLAESVVDAAAPLEKPVLSDPLFFDTLVKQIVRDDKPFEVFEQVAVPEGFPPAVRGTLRDLLDAGINQENVDALIQEGFAGKEVDLGSLRSLLNLHRLYLRRVEKLSVVPRARLLEQAIKLAPQSAYLKGFREILYYGFYDLTGLQADFFQVVVKNFDSRFFFPYRHNHPAYVFAKNFWDVFVQPVKKEEIVIDSAPPTPQIRVTNVSGLRDEAWFVANEIRRLHDEDGVAFSDMAVVARTRDRLDFHLHTALADRSIPSRASSYPSLLEFPGTQEALKILEHHRPDDEISTWKEFAALAEKTLAASSWHAVSQDPLSPDGNAAPGRIRHSRVTIVEPISSLSIFDEINKRVTWKTFVETLRDRWGRTEVRDPGSSDAGVALLYAEASRGLPFKAVFLIGVEEKVFPRIVREDPFLRDDAREALNAIGHKISKKMTALDEERLLFELIVASPSERLHVLYQRSDDDGGVVGASPFLRAFAAERGIDLDKETVSLPRPLLEKIKITNPAVLGPSDAIIGLLAAQKQSEAAKLAGAVGRDKDALEQGLRLQKAIHSFTNPGPYDGLLGAVPTTTLFRDGKISATGLESYALCGYKYFASRVLGLAPLEVDEPEEALAAAVRGTLVHAFVETFFRRVTKDGAQPPPAKFPKKEFDAIFEEVVTGQAPPDVKIPFVLWQATRAALRAVLAVFIENELALLHAGGAAPVLFEAKVEGALPAPLDGYIWTGTIDRVDMKGDTAEILDYKTGRPFTVKSVATLAEKGEKLQAPLYISFAKQFLGRLGRKAVDFSFRYEFIDHAGQSRRLSAEDWAEHSKPILAAIRALVDAAHSGNFLMAPGYHCDFCEVARVCRKNHGISVFRAEKGRGDER